MSSILSIMFLIMGFIPLNAILMQAIQTIGDKSIFVVETIKNYFLFMLYLVVDQRIRVWLWFGLTTLASYIIHTSIIAAYSQLTNF